MPQPPPASRGSERDSQRRTVRPSSSPATDFAAFSNFFDHYFPRVLAFALRRTSDAGAAERLTEAILGEAVLAEPAALRGARVPGREADAVLLRAARRVAAQRGS